MYHAVRLVIGDKLFFAPLQNPTAILDIGTGTGIWAIDVGMYCYHNIVSSTIKLIVSSEKPMSILPVK